MASPAHHAQHAGPTLEASDRPARVARHVSPAGAAAGAGASAGGGAGGAGGGGTDASAAGGEAADAGSWGYWQLRRSPVRQPTDPRSSPCWSGGGSFSSSLDRPATDPRRSPFVGGGGSGAMLPPRQSPARQSPRHAPGAMLPPPPRATKKEASAEGQQAMTDDDMTSWLLHGPMAGTSDDNPAREPEPLSPTPNP